MGKEVYIDLEIIADLDDEYLIRVDKEVLNTLVSFNRNLIMRHWDGDKPVVLEPYGKDFVRTREDAKSSNNLTELSKISAEDLLQWIISS